MSECMCGGEMFVFTDPLTKNIRGLNVTVSDIQYNVCLDCGDISFNLEEDITSKYVEAYKAMKSQ